MELCIRSEPKRQRAGRALCFHPTPTPECPPEDWQSVVGVWDLLAGEYFYTVTRFSLDLEHSCVVRVFFFLRFFKSSKCRLTNSRRSVARVSFSLPCPALPRHYAHRTFLVLPGNNCYFSKHECCGDNSEWVLSSYQCLYCNPL